VGVLRVWGGPLDGAPVTIRNRTPTVWIEDSEPHRVKLSAGPGRLMHRLQGDRLVYVELTLTVCEGCGALHARADSCVLCGAQLP